MGSGAIGVTTQNTSGPGSEGVRSVDPLRYPDWDSLLEARPDASFFHRGAWARVLQETYGHQPYYISRIGNGRIEQLLAIMEVSSPWTGRRGVSLPFTDFCIPLGASSSECRVQSAECQVQSSECRVQNAEGRALSTLNSQLSTSPGTSSFSLYPSSFAPLYSHALTLGRDRGWRYLECRGPVPGWAGATPSLSFCSHSIDLTPGAETLFKRCESSVRRAIRKAEKAVRVEFDTSETSVRSFYSLHCGTRRKHGVPPQPYRFFQNIARHVLGAGHGFVATAVAEGKPVAASIFFHAGREAIYKFGASDLHFQHLRPSNLVMWESMKRLAGEGRASLQMGRTSWGNEGLRRFKLGFGAREENLEYFRFDFRKNAFVTDVDRAESWANHIFRLLPGPAFRLAGSLLYKHLS